MCIYRVIKQKLKKHFFFNLKKKLKIPQEGCATQPNISRLGVSDVKDTAKNNKD